MENAEQNNNKVPIAARIDPLVFAAVEQLAREDDRSLSNMVERLLRQSPPIQVILESAAETVAA